MTRVPRRRSASPPSMTHASPSPSPATRGGRFVNLDRARRHGLGDGPPLGGAGTGSPAGAAPRPAARRCRRWRRTSRCSPPRPRRASRRALTWLGHASCLVQLDGVSLLVDPALRGRDLRRHLRRNVAARRAHRRSCRPSTRALVSHGHYDHLDLPTLEARRRAGRRRASGSALVFRGARALLRPSSGWWRRRRGRRRVRVTFVPAQHWSRRGPARHEPDALGRLRDRGLARDGLPLRRHRLLRRASPRSARASPAIDAALLPIGAYDPGWFMERQHMNPEQALQAFEDLGARTFVAMHWGTFKLTDEPLDEPPRRLEAERAPARPARRERVRVLAVGRDARRSARGADVRGPGATPGVSARHARCGRSRPAPSTHGAPCFGATGGARFSWRARCRYLRRGRRVSSDGARSAGRVAWASLRLTRVIFGPPRRCPGRGGWGVRPPCRRLGTSSDGGVRATALPRYTRRAGALLVAAAPSRSSPAATPRCRGTASSSRTRAPRWTSRSRGSASRTASRPT